EALSEEKALQTNGNLVARSSGYVTYIKDFSDSDMVSSGENIVIISDYEDTYVKLDAYTNDSDRITENYHYFYALIDGERYELEPYDYLPIELSMAQGKGVYLNARMKLSDGGELPEVGSDFSVLFYRELSENVLVIGKDSVYEDDKGDFVYVKTDEGKEMRYVELGNSDMNYVEVLSGLSEGEWVYYTSGSVIPESYEEYTVSLQDYTVYGASEFYTVRDSKRKKIFSMYEGQITEVYVEQGEVVEKGQLICTVKTNEGSALLTEMSNSIDSFKSGYAEGVKAYEEAILLKEQEIEAAYIASQNPPVEQNVATDTDAPMAPDEGVYEPYYYEQLCCQLEVMKLNHELEKINYDYNIALMVKNYNTVSCNNDGNGTMMIYAEEEGKLSNVNIKAGKNIYVGDRLFNIEIPSKHMVELRVENIPADNLYMNQTVKFTNPTTDKSYTGTVIGTTGSVEYFYFTSIDDKMYMTSNITNGDARFYIEMPGEFYDEPEDYAVGYPVIFMKDVVVVPKDAVYIEEQIEKLYHYVWKIVDGEFVKQYVQLLPTDGKSVSEICILSGLKEGDKIILEKGEE
ncbi:MAG: efflux RND transporter periplasmic adaptor subunit, partial [Lachnospiraceae bacterium]|nr:efflux RND transporter periplasmic adaptor subunit [Lachnospiraceae bacterium]